MTQLDVITIGRSSVDLYGVQIGGRLEDMTSFNKYIGGSPTNIAAGTARLGLKSGLITRVGDEHMGRFIREQLIAEGVDVTSVITDPERLTSLVLLGIRDKQQFPLIFYRENCADMALCAADIDPDYIALSKCLIATGTHLSHPQTEAAVLKALRAARDAGRKTALDIDYRPNLWGLARHGDGENRFITSEAVTAKLQSTLSLFQLIVGTEEEFHIASGVTDTLMALKIIRKITDAVLVCKLGPMGAVAFSAEIPDSLDKGIWGPVFPIDVYNVLGAGDGFMSGLLKGWLTECDWATSLIYANACGALAVSRHGCTPAYPSWDELQFFLKRGITLPALRQDRALEQIHWSTTRAKDWSVMRVFAFDHRLQFEQIVQEVGAETAKIGLFKKLCLQATVKVSQGRDGYGLLCDARFGEEALYEAAGQGLWIGRPVEDPGTRPLKLEIGPDFGTALSSWAKEHVVKVLCFYHPSDTEAMRQAQEETLLQLFYAARAQGLDFLLEVIPSKVAEIDAQMTADMIDRFYQLGIYPDWWKLEPMLSEASWQKTCQMISDHDPYCRGIMILGLEASLPELRSCFESAAKFDLVKGFAVGRSIFADPARQWLSGAINDVQAVEAMADVYADLCQMWDQARALKVG